MSRVSEILEQMAQNAGQAALRRGALIGGAIDQAGQIPAQYFADKQRQQALDLHTAQVNQQMGLEQARASRENQVNARADTAQNAADLKEAALKGIIGAGFAADPSKFDLPTAITKAHELGAEDLIPTVMAVHEKMQPKLTSGAPGSVMRNEAGQVVPGSQIPALPSTASNEVEKRRIYAKQASGAALTPAESASLQGFTAEADAGKVKPLDQQLLEAVAKGDTVKVAQIQKTFATEASAKRDPAAAAQLAAIRNLTQEAAQQRLDDADTGSDKNQQKFEQQYRTVLQRGLSSRSGGLGLEDAKVQQANHLMSIFEQNYDPKTGEWNIPRVQLNELALGLARLTSPGGQAGEGMLKEFQQRTAKGDVAGALTYLTGQPVAANTQAITQMLKDSIERQGRTAETNREGEMAYLRGLAPTDLAEPRRKQLEKTSLNALRQSRVIQNSQTGERKLQVSTDGGETWK